ncbi:hypothetical protein IQ07DRAFT_5919 [Pyrenochaeta sp. DS3sAY3a]|nr:hypothetical protein IQ07DRAFT_5919 [Pyrenochaeta sp. DS3sAY3a]
MPLRMNQGQVIFFLSFNWASSIELVDSPKASPPNFFFILPSRFGSTASSMFSWFGGRIFTKRRPMANSRRQGVMGSFPSWLSINTASIPPLSLWKW